METARLQFAPIMGGRVPPKPPLWVHRGPGTPYNGGETPPNPPSSLRQAERPFFLPPRLAPLALDNVAERERAGFVGGTVARVDTISLDLRKTLLEEACPWQSR